MSQATANASIEAERTDDDERRENALRDYFIQADGIAKSLLPKAEILMKNPKKRSSLFKDLPSHTDALPTQGEFLALAARAEKGGEKAQSGLRDMLDRHPSI